MLIFLKLCHVWHNLVLGFFFTCVSRFVTRVSEVAMILFPAMSHVVFPFVSFLWLCYVVSRILTRVFFLGRCHSYFSWFCNVFLRLCHVCRFSGCFTCVVSQAASRVLFLRFWHVCCFSGCVMIVISQSASHFLLLWFCHLRCFSGCS